MVEAAHVPLRADCAAVADWRLTNEENSAWIDGVWSCCRFPVLWRKQHAIRKQWRGRRWDGGNLFLGWQLGNRRRNGHRRPAGDWRQVGKWWRVGKRRPAWHGRSVGNGRGNGNRRSAGNGRQLSRRLRWQPRCQHPRPRRARFGHSRLGCARLGPAGRGLDRWTRWRRRHRWRRWRRFRNRWESVGGWRPCFPWLRQARHAS